MPRQQLTVAALVAAAVVALGSLLPWVEVDLGFLGSVDKAGTEGDGVLTLFGAALAAGLVLWGWRRPGRGAVVGTAVVAALVVVIAAYDVIDVSNAEIDGMSVDATVGIGLWLTLLGGVALLTAAIVRVRQSPAAPVVPPPPASWPAPQV